MLPLNTSTTLHPPCGRRRPLSPSRRLLFPSVAFVEPTGESSQHALPPTWTYTNTPPMSYPNPYYPPCQYAQSYETEPMPYTMVEPMEISFDVEPVTLPIAIPQTVKADCISQEAILAEIVRECDMIQRRSPSMEASSPSTGYSSDDSDNQARSPGGKHPAKRERKKAQNREAATRYREKKRKEKEQNKAKIDGLLEINEQLKTKASAIQGEIDYLKKLMAEIGMRDEHVQYISPVVPL